MFRKLASVAQAMLYHFSIIAIIFAVNLIMNNNEAAAAGKKVTAAEIVSYLNSIQSIEADFNQSISPSNFSKGKLYLKKPGRLKMRYSSPNDVLFILNRGKLTFYDYSLKEYSKIFNDHKVLDVITDAKFHLNEVENHFVQNVGDGVIFSSLILNKKKSPTEMSLFFKKNPLKLVGFSFIDTNGGLVEIMFSNPKYNSSIADKEFEFRSPNLSRSNNY